VKCNHLSLIAHLPKACQCEPSGLDRMFYNYARRSQDSTEKNSVESADTESKVVTEH
jgi:hypothetical protein